MSVQVVDSELKARHRAMWGSGDYPHMVQTFLLPLGPRLVDACGIGPETRVLDVAAGTGNASIPAARRGARVTASDLTPALLEDGRRRAEADGLELEWVEADAEALPFDDASFDVVMSSIGAMFAPHHQAVADELVRVCRPGGTIGLLSWTPEGMIGELFRTMKPFAPAPPPGRSPRRCGAARSISAGSCVRAWSSTRSSATCWTSPPSSVRATTGSTSRATTARRSRRARTPSATAPRPTSTPRSSASARRGRATPPRHALRDGVPARRRPAGLTTGPQASPARAGEAGAVSSSTQRGRRTARPAAASATGPRPAISSAGRAPIAATSSPPAASATTSAALRAAL